MNIFKTEAFVIKRRNFRESDRMLTLFTKDQGKIQVVAKGIRKVPSRRSAHVELLNQVVVGLHQSRGLPLLTEAQSIDTFDGIKSDLQKVGFSYHLCELIDGLCPENQEHRSVYFLLEQTLRRLSITDDLVSVIHSFEIELLSQLGYWRNADVTKVATLDTHHFIENILERKLRSRAIFQKLN